MTERDVKSTDDNLNRMAEFKDTELENNYRQHEYKEDAIVACFIIGILVLLHFGYVLMDLLTIGSSSNWFPWVFTCRCLTVIWSISCFWVIRSGRNHQHFDRLLLSWVLLNSLTIMMVINSRDPGHVSNYVLDVLFIPAIFMVSFKLKYQILSAFLYVFGLMFLLLTIKQMPASIDNVIVIVSFFVAAIGGSLISFRIHGLRRSRFLTWIREKKLKEDLEHAMAEINTLKEIVPICSKCKSVRDDDGFWNQVETYISKYQKVELSHGLCPTCLEESLQEVRDFKRRHTQSHDLGT